mmetsp:Transcript_8856/g.29153  ORF Transcript_8856/g.29153 Transcript_8856/m.29153 type:complete len:237 (-) Transcript_8856:217-927(-)
MVVSGVNNTSLVGVFCSVRVSSTSTTPSATSSSSSWSSANVCSSPALANFTNRFASSPRLASAPRCLRLSSCRRRNVNDAVSGKNTHPNTAPTNVNVDATTMGNKYGYVSNTVPANARGQRSAGRCKYPPTPGAAALANPYPSANTPNARPALTLVVISPTYVFTIAAFPFARPDKNRPNAARVVVVAVPNAYTEIVLATHPAINAGRRPCASLTRPHAYAPHIAPSGAAAPHTPT